MAQSCPLERPRAAMSEKRALSINLRFFTNIVSKSTIQLTCSFNILNTLNVAESPPVLTITI